MLLSRSESVSVYSVGTIVHEFVHTQGEVVAAFVAIRTGLIADISNIFGRIGEVSYQLYWRRMGERVKHWIESVGVCVS